jgi:4-diphosphocytidyl-2-C-methyl-D-erythritol kinase
MTPPATPAPAKVNLFLHAGPVKANGRHDLDSLVAFAGTGASDYVLAEPAGEISLTVNGPFGPQAGRVEDNLVLRAAKALQQAAGVTAGARIELQKWLPVAAGIGGGSSDAAAVLRRLTEIWGVDPAHARAIAPGLGGDVPVALEGRPALMRGEGERVTPVQLPPISALLVNPRVACPTGPVFRAYDEAGGGAGFSETGPWAEFSAARELSGWLARQRNDLEAPAIRLVPQIGEVLSLLRRQRGALLARMSGSGATCFALFAELAEAELASVILRRERPDWWVVSTRLGGTPWT